MAWAVLFVRACAGRAPGEKGTSFALISRNAQGLGLCLVEDLASDCSAEELLPPRCDEATGHAAVVDDRLISGRASRSATSIDEVLRLASHTGRTT
ncbi:hypothetical protein [Streptomyces sp. NPDC088757]|uniref:hypothetical protein n=1 Tax=Streptomyces sp. NPDC088757 TaxID=3365889 RepID=UPI00380C3E4E